MTLICGLGACSGVGEIKSVCQRIEIRSLVASKVNVDMAYKQMWMRLHALTHVDAIFLAEKFYSTPSAFSFMPPPHNYRRSV